MEIEGKKIIDNGKKLPKWIWIGYVICIIAIIGAVVWIYHKEEHDVPDAVDFTTDGALGMNENVYAYLDVQGLTDEVAIYGDTENTSNIENDRYYIALNEGYWYVVDLNFETIDKLKEIQEYTYSTDENATVPEPVRIYGMTENVSDDLKKMLVDFYNEGVEAENQIGLDDFERYFGSVLLNVRKSPVDTTLQEVIIIFSILGFFAIAVSNIIISINNFKMKKYITKNNYEEELARQLEESIEEKHYKGKVIITKDFFVDLKNGGLKAFKFSDVKWLHIHSVKYCGIVTVSSGIIVHLKDGKTNIKCVEINGKTTEEFLEIFNKICDKVPTNCLKGYTQENIKEYKQYKKEIKY